MSNSVWGSFMSVENTNSLILDLVYIGLDSPQLTTGKLYKVEIPNAKTLTEDTLRNGELSMYIIDNNGIRTWNLNIKVFSVFKSLSEVRNDKINEILG